MITLRNMHIPVVMILAGSLLLAMAAAQSNTAGSLAPFLARPASATRVPDANGFLQRWLILEPISVSGQTEGIVRTAVKTEYFANQFTVIPHDGDKVMVGDKELIWHAVDTNDYNLNLNYFAKAFGKTSDNALFWAVTVVNCPQDIPDVRMAIGSNAASVWWVNGKEVTGIYGDRQTVVDDGVSKRLTLKKGPNIVRCAIVNGSGASDFCARFLDKDEKPLTGFTLTVGSTKRP